MSGGIFSRKRLTQVDRIRKNIRIFAVLILGAILSCIVFKSFAEIINDVRVDVDSDLTYYLNVKEDGIDATGIESSDAQIANVLGGRVNVTDKIPEGLVFQGFVTTSDGTIGAVSRADSSIQCPGKVIDDTNEETVDTGTWNNDHTEYYYHGLHYNANTRTVSFSAEKIKAGCQLTVGIITKTPTTIDDPSTTPVETRRDFYNTAFAAERGLTATSNTVHAFIGDSEEQLYAVSYAYTGTVPAGAPTTPSEESYAQDSTVPVNANPILEGYTFSGWTTTDATVTDGTFPMPNRNVRLVGLWTKNPEGTKYNVTYVINGEKPADFMPPAQKQYEAGVSVPLDSTEKDVNIDGYRFSGWSTTDATLSETGFIMPSQDVTIVGSFERISYKVCYAFEGAIIPAGASVPPCEDHYPGDTVTTAANPVAAGYDFLGWYKNATFTMPEEDVTIYGEWAETLGTFTPQISKSLVDAQTEYIYGETVKFKITVHNPESFAIKDVYLQEELDGAIFTASANNSYELKTNTIVVIPNIPANSSVDVYAEYKVTENRAQTLTNIVELTGALADNHTLDTSQEYKATIDFNTVPEPVPLTGIIFNALPYIGLIVLGIGIIFILIISSRKLEMLNKLSTISSSINPRKIFKYSLPCFAIIGILIGATVVKNVAAGHYTEVIKSIELTSQHTNYSNSEPGSWHITKSAKWIEQNKARITFDVDTVAKVAEGTHTDIVMVLDNSGSMSGDKITQVKHDATELIESVLSDSNNRIGLVSFNSTATKLSNLTSDKTTLIDLVNRLDTPGCTNYYDGFLKAEEILEGYQKQDNRELIMLFLTDGYPNEQTPNEIPEYQALKAKYPYMTINGIQYEMGDEVLDPIKQISDNQFIANMNSLNNILFEASISPYIYENFTLTDYIDDEYWDVDSVDGIEASIGETSLTHEGAVPVVTWSMNEALMSGHSAQLTIDITLKNTGTIEEGTFLPTNDHETVQSHLADTPDENIASELTPVLKSSYKVSYEENLPSGCSSYGGTLPEAQNYLPLSIVGESSNVLTCDSYNFVGWDVAEGDPKPINDDYFKIISDDVVLRAIWSKVSISKSMDGEVKEEVVAILNTGQNINVALKKLSGQTGAGYYTDNTTITAVKPASTMSSAQQASASVISAADSPMPIYAWFDNTDGTIYIYSEADKIKAGTNLSGLFYGFKNLNDISALSAWDTSSVTDMSYMLFGASTLTNIDALTDWDTSSVTNMSCMFFGASSLTNIDGAANWDTSSVITMKSMLLGASSLTNIDSASNWDTSSVTTMQQMFSGASSLANIDALSAWDTSGVTNMSSMFSGASSLTNIDALTDWDTSSVANMYGMFDGASSLANIDALTDWNTSSVTNMQSMFSDASSLSNIDGAAGWDTSKVTNMSYMFNNASSLTNINGAAGWDTSSVTNMSYMFNGASSLTNIDALTDWDTSSVTTMRSMFYGVSSLADIDGVSGWNTSSVTIMARMFQNASSLTNIDGASGWNTSKVTDMSYMFDGTSSLIDIDGASGWDTSSVTDMQRMFYGASNLTNIDGASDWDTSSVTTMQYMFNSASSLTNIDGAANWHTSKVTNMSSMFSGASSLTNIDGASDWDTSSVTTMLLMFSGATSLANIDGASDWDTSSVTNMSSMFSGASSLTNIDGASDWDTSSVTTMYSMFSSAKTLANIDGATSWNTSKVTDMRYMFSGASSLTNIDGVAGWDTSSVTTMSGMFYGASSLADIDGVSGWNTSSVTNMYAMFQSAFSLTNIDGAAGWNTSKVTDMSYMFRDCRNIASLNPIFNWDTSSLTNKSGMFNNIPASVTRPGWY